MSVLIAYFSRGGENYVSGRIIKLTSGNTARVAGIIKKFITADEFPIEMVQPYSVKYNECIDEAQKDQKAQARPQITDFPQNLEQYDTIYLGYPIYWGTMPMAVFTFLEHFDLTGKTIRPFCTHEGSGLGSSVGDIRETCSGVKVGKGLAIHGSRIDVSEKEIKNWLNS